MYREVEVFAFPKKENLILIKKKMLYKDFLLLKNSNYDYRAYQIGFNTTILKL